MSDSAGRPKSCEHDAVEYKFWCSEWGNPNSVYASKNEFPACPFCIEVVT